MYAEIFAGLHDSPERHLKTTFEADHDEMVMVRDIQIYSACEHHLIPFIGKAHIAYIPGEDGRITGLSQLDRLADVYARRPQVKESITVQLVAALERVINTPGLHVVEAGKSVWKGRR